MFVDDAITVCKGQPNFLQPRPRENDGFWRVGRNFWHAGAADFR